MMNLDNLFSEGDISKFDAMNDDQIYSVTEMNLDSMNSEKKAKVSKKELLANENKKICLKASKRLQNQGKTAKEIKSYIKERFASFFIPEGLDDTLDKEEGIFGVVLVDCSAFDNKSEYDKLPLSVKNNHQYAVKCGCQDRYSFKQAKSSKISGDINAFISDQDDFEEMPIATEICPKTGLPVLNKVKDYTDDDAVEFLNCLEKNRQITTEEKKNILATATSPLNCAKRAFNLIHKKAEKETNKVVDNFNTYALGKNNTNVTVSKKAKENLKVSNLSEAPIKAAVGKKAEKNLSFSDLKVAPINPEIGKNLDGVTVTVNGGKIIPVAIENPCEKLINIKDFQDPQMKLNNTDLKKDISVDVKNEVDIPVVIEDAFEVVPEIERGEIVDGEWYENINDLQEDVEVDGEFENFNVDGSSNFLI